MIVLGLTGSIGMGKTTAGQMLERMGCPVHDSDLSVKKALEPYGRAFTSVALAFPKAWDKKKHVLKKDVLSDLVFADKAAREKLEHMLHPIVQDEQQIFIKKQRKMGRKFCALDIPLLFETGADERVNYTIAVHAPFFIQAQRVLQRKGMSEEKFEQILNAQMPSEQKCALADFVVQSGLGKAHMRKQLREILDHLS